MSRPTGRVGWHVTQCHTQQMNTHPIKVCEIMVFPHSGSMVYLDGCQPHLYGAYLYIQIYRKYIMEVVTLFHPSHLGTFTDRATGNETAVLVLVLVITSATS